MRKAALVLLLTLVMVAALPALTALAHNVGPCNDGTTTVASVADGATGLSYATHHIVSLAKAGELGAGGHIPGTHHGFSACDPSGG